jgi:methylmalonyl-CoA mutase cobalamin-binding domain/chain
VIRLLLVELEPGDQETRGLARALRDEGAEVVYTAARNAGEIVTAAVQEDVRAVGLVIRTDDHRRIGAELAEHKEIVVFATAGGDERELRAAGVQAIFRATSADRIVTWAGQLG